jgi:hypothetical protein
MRWKRIPKKRKISNYRVLKMEVFDKQRDLFFNLHKDRTYGKTITKCPPGRG